MPIPTQGCVSLDPPGGCGEGTWGNIEELPGDVHLDVNYAGDDSDGSREKPWTLYGYAVGQVQAGGRIVFAAGDYDQGMLVSKSISLVGRCSSMVTISGVRQGTYEPTVVEVKGDVEVTVSDVTLSGPGVGLFALSGALLSVERVRVQEGVGVGIVAFQSGTSLVASEIEVVGTKPDSQGLYGYGMEANSGASVTVTRSRVLENHAAGIAAFGGDASVEGSELWIAHTQLSPSGRFGYGAQAGDGASLSLSLSLVSDNHRAGLAASGAGTSAEIDAVWISSTEQDAEGRGGSGLEVESGATVSASRLRLTSNRVAAIAAFGSETSVDVEETWISETRLDDDGRYGFGVEAGGGATVSVTRARLSANRTAAIRAYGSGTSAAVEQVSVLSTETNGKGHHGYGLWVNEEASLSVARSWVVGNRTAGVEVDGVGTEVAVQESSISETEPDEGGGGGRGISVSGGASMSVTQTRIARNVRAGIGAFEPGTSVTASELLISDHQLSPEGRYGFGVSSSMGASVAVERTQISGNHSAGIAVGGAGASLTASEIWVFGTRPNAAGNIGHGLNTLSGASLNVTGSKISENHATAITFIASGGSLVESILEGSKLDGGLLGDGLVVTGSVVTVDRIISRDNARAGVLFDKSDGEVSGSLITQNAIGLANQGLPGAEIADDNVIEGNDQDRIDDGDLEVPDESTELPDLPEGGP